ncbi:MAG: hypothetical protein WBO06_06620, partial [Gammaproteobacteria bacterium]
IKPVGSNSFDQRCFIVICHPDAALGRIPDKAPGTSEFGPTTVIYPLDMGKSQYLYYPDS